MPQASDGWWHLTTISDIPNVAQYVTIRGFINQNNNIHSELNGAYGLHSNAYYHLQSTYTSSGGVVFLTIEYTKTTD